jgi:hypothetical protein
MRPLRRRKLEYLLENLSDDEIAPLLERLSKQTWPHIERRTRPRIHYIGDRRSWRPFTDARRERTPWVILAGLLGMTAVLFTALASMPHHPEMLLAIPGYAVYFSIVMFLRARELAMANM